MNTFNFGGTASSAYNVYIASGSSLAIPERDVTIISVPGRDGDLIIDNGAYKNITINYGCIMLHSTSYTLAQQLTRVRNWLYASFTYRALYDDYDTGYYWNALPVGGISDVTVRGNAAFFTIKFSCKPTKIAR